MPLEIGQFIRSRPFLYHLTARQNVEGVRAFGGLRPAADILNEARQQGSVRLRRTVAQVVDTPSGSYHIRDQAPLHAGNLRLSGGWSFPDFVQHLNSHVFFWPGDSRSPIAYGRRHFARYADEDNVVLCAKTDELIELNGGLSPRFCCYNSGSPRCSGGKPSPRGPRTFLDADEFGGTPSSVVEVVFGGPVKLPKAVRVCPVSDFL